MGPVYMISLRECGSTLYRANNFDTPKITSTAGRFAERQQLEV